MIERDDAAQLAELSRELPRIDVDAPSAQRISQRARQAIGRGAPASRFIEPVLVVALEIGISAWMVIKLFEVLS